jgi:hypothetical protein
MMACYRTASMLMHAPIAATDAAGALAAGRMGTAVSTLFRRSVAQSLWALIEETPKMHRQAHRRRRAAAVFSNGRCANGKAAASVEPDEPLSGAAEPDQIALGPPPGGHEPHFARTAPVNRLHPGLFCAIVSAAVLLVPAARTGVAIAQTANSNAGLEGGQDGLFDAILATPNYKTPGLPDSAIATVPGLEQAAPAPQFTANGLAPALYNSSAEFLSSGGSQTLEGSPLVRLAGASQLFATPIRVSGAASLETERLVDAPGAAIDYIRPSAEAQYINPANDLDYSPYPSYVPRLDFDPTFANNFATRQDINFGIDKVFNFDGAFNRLPEAPNSSANVWSFGFNVGAQRRFRDPSPQSYAFFFTRRWFEEFAGVSQRDLTWEPTGVVEYVIPADFLGGSDAARWRGAPAIDFVAR